MAEEDSQLCLQSVQFMTHNMLATSLPRSNIFSWTSKTSRRQSLKAFWIIHGLVVKLPMKQLTGFEGQGNLRIGQLSFSFCFSCCPIHQPLAVWPRMSVLFCLFMKGRAGNETALLAFKHFLSFQFPTRTFCCTADVLEWKKKKSENNIYIFMWKQMSQNWLPVSRSC